MLARTLQGGDRGDAGVRMVAGLVVAALLAVAGLWLAVSATTQVGTGEIAVMTRFGRVTGQELGEGFHIKNPLDRANKYDVKVQVNEAEAAAASKDLQDVKSTLVLNYALEAGQVSEVHKRVGVDYKVKLIDPALQEVFKAATARYDATQLITERAAVKQDAFSLLRERLAGFGIRVVDLSIVDFSFSAEFSAAIEAKQVAQQNAERAEFNLLAARTDAEAQRAQAETLSELYLRKIFLEKWDGKMPQVMGNDASLFLDMRPDAQ